MRYRYISELAGRNPDERSGNNIFSIPVEETLCSGGAATVNVLAIGDVGSTVLLGLMLAGREVIDTIGIYDIDEKNIRRFEREMNQIRFPDGRKMPEVRGIDESRLFDCDVMVFCASKGVPAIGEKGDVRMAQLEVNRGLVSHFGKMASERAYKGLFAVVSDPVDQLCMAAMKAGLRPEQVQGYGLGVMNGRAAYYASKDDRFSSYLTEGRAFGPHGSDLVIANSITDYDDTLSRELTGLAVNANMEMRNDGFKPYIAPAISSGAIAITETIGGGWNYSSVFIGNEKEGGFLGCRNRRAGGLAGECIEIEELPLHEKLFERIKSAYDNLKEELV